MINEVLNTEEKEILKIVALGGGNQKISEKLSLSLDEVKVKLNSIYSKLNVKNRLQAVIYCAYNRIVDYSGDEDF